MKKAKRHKQYKTKRKEKADAALVEAEKSQGKKMDSETSSMPVFALFSTLKVLINDSPKFSLFLVVSLLFQLFCRTSLQTAKSLQL
jgi:hypothetical protein